MSIKLGLLASSQQQAAPLLLDQYPGATAAYSLRKLRTAYTGAAIRVRRSDNTEINIGFVSGVLDITTLLTFCGVFNGFVTIWYDQSGNGNNLFNIFPANQPQIVSNGVITYRNGKPYIILGGSSGFNFTNTITTTINQSFSFWMTYEKAVATNIAVLINFPGNSYHWLDYLTTQYVSASNFITITSLAANSLGLINIITNYSVGATMYRNGASIGSRGPLTSGSSSTAFIFGTNPLIRVSEYVFYPSTKTSDKSGIDTNINSFYTIY
jgi:hypothetical protein